MASNFVAVVNGSLYQLKQIKQNALIEIAGGVYAGNVYASEDMTVVMVEEVKQLEVIPIETIVTQQSENGKEGNKENGKPQGLQVSIPKSK